MKWENWYNTIVQYWGGPTNITDGAVWNGKRPPGIYACPASKGKIFNASSQATDYGYNIELHSKNSEGIYRADRMPKVAVPGKLLILADVQRLSDPARVGGRDLAPYYATTDGGMATRHGGKSNVLFLDGHIEQIAPQDLTESAL